MVWWIPWRQWKDPVEKNRKKSVVIMTPRQALWRQSLGEDQELCLQPPTRTLFSKACGNGVHVEMQEEVFDLVLGHNSSNIAISMEKLTYMQQKELLMNLKSQGARKKDELMRSPATLYIQSVKQCASCAPTILHTQTCTCTLCVHT